MARDEILADESYRRLKARYPNLVAIDITVESNPHAHPGYANNVAKTLSLHHPVESLASSWYVSFSGGEIVPVSYCANPKCCGTQVDLSDLCHRKNSPDGGSVPFREDVRCKGYEGRTSNKMNDFSKHNIECPNVLRISGTLEFS